MQMMHHTNTSIAPKSSSTISTDSGIISSGYNRRVFVLTTIGCFAFVAWLRVLVGYQPHSGQDNYQGPSSILVAEPTTATTTTTTNLRPYGGDYEAQRHWMELTVNLPIGEWYYYDTHYWGLDYPPLTAYHSYICGYICRYSSNNTILSQSVALLTSRGYEDPIHKAYMRSTVLVSDLICYGTVVWMFTRSAASLRSQLLSVSSSSSSLFMTSTTLAWTFIYPMIQPAIILIDHGHFQYNTVALGLSLWSIYYLTKKGLRSSDDHSTTTMTNCIIGSIFFCCALSFKQMTLYYAPAIFMYLLGRCFAATTNTNNSQSDVGHRQTTSSYVWTSIYRIALLGVTVLFTFTLLWWPFIVYGPDDTTYMDRAKHMFQRIIPIQRGLFEGKVSNLWCALSVSPFRIRQRLPISYQPIAAFLLTVILLIPSSVHLFFVGLRNPSNKSNHENSSYYTYDRQQLLWGTMNSALAFFLASFQVHEKSLLLAFAPCSLLLVAQYSNGNTNNNDTTTITDPKFVHWFSIVTIWTLWPLLQIDRLQTAYLCTIIVFISMIGLHRELVASFNSSTIQHPMSNGFFDYYSVYYVDWIPTISYTIMILLHITECIIVVPNHLPDLFPVLWSIVGCGFCCLAYIITCWQMWYLHRLMNPTIAMRSTPIHHLPQPTGKSKDQ